MTAHRVLPVAVTVLTLGLAAGLSACGGTPMPTPSTSASSASTSTATPAATPTPTPTAAAFAVSCDTVLSPGRVAALSAAGSLVAPADFFAKVASDGMPSPYTIFEANGGVVCAYSAGSEVSAVYGYTKLNPGQSGEIGSLISGSDPYSSTPYAGGTLYSTQMDGNPFALFLVLESATYLASSQEILDDLLATVPLT